MRKRGISKSMEHVTSFFNSKFLKDPKTRFLIIELPLLVLTFLGIVIVGYVNSITEFPIEKIDHSKIKKLPAEQEYFTAEEYYSDISDFKYVDLSVEINLIYNDLLNLYTVENNINQIRDYIGNHLQSKFKNSYVVVKRTDDIKLTKQNTDYQASVVAQKEKQIDSLKTIMYESSVFLRERYERIIKESKKTITSIQRFNGYIIELGVSPQIYYEWLDTYQSYSLTAGLLNSIQNSGTKYEMDIDNPKPVLKKEFIDRTDLNTEIQKSDIMGYDLISNRYEEKRQNIINQFKKEIEDKAKHNRRLYRNDFRTRHIRNIWFFTSNYYAIVLFLTTVIFVLTGMAAERKMSFKKYFASNISVVGLKISAVLILIFGIILAFYNMSNYIFDYNKALFLADFFGFDSVVFYPLNFFIRLYLFTIGVFIISEILCFLTSLFNVYYYKSKLIDEESAKK